MANELKRIFGSAATLQNADGSSVGNAAIQNATTADYDNSSTGYPHAKFTLTTAGFGGTPTAMSVIEVVVRSMDVDGTTDTVAPTATYRPLVVGRFVINASSSAGTFECYGYDIPPKGSVYLYNDTGQTLSANWTLKITPFTFVPS